MLPKHVHVVLDTLLPSQSHPALKTGGLEAGFAAFWPEFLQTAVPSLRLAFKAALLAAVWVAPLLIGRLPPLTRHDRLTRVRALAALETSPLAVLRQLLLVLKMVASFAYGADPSVRAAAGYPRRPPEAPPTARP
jgi:hypothetical protein